MVPRGGPPRRPAAGAAGRSPREPGDRSPSGVRPPVGIAPGSRPAPQPPAGRRYRSSNGACRSRHHSRSPDAIGPRPWPSWLPNSLTAGSTTATSPACRSPLTPSWSPITAGTPSASAPPQGTVPQGASEADLADTSGPPVTAVVLQVRMTIQYGSSPHPPSRSVLQLSFSIPLADLREQPPGAAARTPRYHGVLQFFSRVPPVAASGGRRKLRSRASSPMPPGPADWRGTGGERETAPSLSRNAHRLRRRPGPATALSPTVHSSLTSPHRGDPAASNWESRWISRN